MRNPATTFMVVVGLALFLPGLLAIGAAESPRGVFSATTDDFGTVRQGEKVTYVFVVRNEGTAPLRIQRVDLSEPEMTARFKPVILPGQEGQIRVEWDTVHLKGQAEGTATVHLDDPAQPQVALVLKGVVKAPIEILPYAAVFASVFKGESADRSLRVLNNEERPLTIRRVEASRRHFTATIETVEPGKIYQLHVRVRPDVPPGRYTEAVYLDTDHPAVSRIEIPVNLFIKTDVYANPEDVDFGQVSLDQLARNPRLLDFLTQTFLVKKRQGDLEIKSVFSDIPFLHITQSPVGRSRIFQITVALVKDRIQRGKIAGTIHILTHDRDFPELVISVRGEVM